MSDPGEHGRLRPDGDVVARRVENEMVLVHLRTNQVYSLNRTGARLWELVGEGVTPAQAIDRLLDEFEVAEADLREEVDDFVQLLVREELVAAEGDGAQAPTR